MSNSENFKNKKILFLIFTLLSFTILCAKKEPPNVIIGLIIDQFASHQLKKIRPYLTGGIKYLLENGYVYTKARHPHGKPATSTGHAAIATGTIGCYHGFINNCWYDENGNKIGCVDDSSPDSAEFKPDSTTYSYGKSAAKLMVDGISDQLIQVNKPDSRNISISLSYKDRAAIALAGKSGNPFWFDTKTGTFTTSKAYVNILPEWLQTFNKNHAPRTKQNFMWQTLFPKDHDAYKFDFINDYRFCSMETMVEKNHIPNLEQKNPYNLFQKLPISNQILVELAKTAFNAHYEKDSDKKLMLWVAFSSPDKLGHHFGPDSMENIDTFYHLDKQIGELISYIEKKTDNKKTLFLLSADHGVMPIVEISHLRGIKHARRIPADILMQKTNTIINNNFGINNLVIKYKAPYFYLDENSCKIYLNEETLF